MKDYQYKTEQLLNISLKEAWDFFTSPSNLSKITPPNLDFIIKSKLSNEPVYEGMKIKYSVKPLLGIPVTWETLISEVKENYCFRDIQLSGPYKKWEHTHTFVEKSGKILMTDEVNYILPFGIFGRLLHKLIVKKRIDNIFGYRRQILDKIFTENGKLVH